MSHLTGLPSQADRVLVVANRTADSNELVNAMHERAGGRHERSIAVAGDQVAPAVQACRPKTVGARAAARHQAGSRGTANRRSRIAIGKANAFARQLIQSWRLDRLMAIAGQIARSHVVGVHGPKTS